MVLSALRAGGKGGSLMPGTPEHTLRRTIQILDGIPVTEWERNHCPWALQALKFRRKKRGRPTNLSRETAIERLMNKAEGSTREWEPKNLPPKEMTALEKAQRRQALED